MLRKALNVDVRSALQSARHPPGTFLFNRLCGSRGHNICSPGSDYDVMGVWVAASKMGYAPNRKVMRSRNVRYYEVTTFAQHLLAGSPLALEMLFGDHECVTTEHWEELIAIRHRFLTKRAVDLHLAILNLHVNNLRTLVSSGGSVSPSQLLPIMLRTTQLNLLASGQAPQMWFEGTCRDFYLHVRAGTYSADKVLKLCGSVITDVPKRRPYPLPDKPDYESLAKWLIRVHNE